MTQNEKFYSCFWSHRDREKKVNYVYTILGGRELRKILTEY